MTMPNLRDVRMLHANPFGQEMLGALRDDLDGAIWARWMVCYFNEDGLDALSPSLERVLSNPRSRGLFTLTCACGVGAVERLAMEVQPPRGRLRVFLPLGEGDRRDDARLLHSKMVLIVRRRQSPAPFETPLEAILYVGSHNWTGPGFRLDGGRKNVESSVRVVADWDPRTEADLLSLAESGNGTTGNPIIDALCQMHTCFELASNTDLADHGAIDELKGWTRANCQGEAINPGQTPVIVLTGVLGEGVDAVSAKSGSVQAQIPVTALPRAGDLVYVQHYNSGREPEVFDSTVAWALLLWEHRSQLQNGEQPWLLLGRARNLGQGDTGDPSLGAVRWMAFDPKQNSPLGASRGGLCRPQSVTVLPTRLRSRGTALQVEYWSVVPVSGGTSSAQLNFLAPDRHALVEIVAVRAPKHRAGDRTERVWEGTELPFHQGRNRKRKRCFLVRDMDGAPSSERAMRMFDEQARLFGIASKGAEDGKGPTGDPDLADVDVFPCAAPINDLLFQEFQGNAVVRPVPNAERSVAFEIGKEVSAFGKGREVPRMERLIAPGVPYVAEALGITLLLEKLGLARGA